MNEAPSVRERDRHHASTRVRVKQDRGESEHTHESFRFEQFDIPPNPRLADMPLWRQWEETQLLKTCL
jgi:hypothetical protein